MFIRISDLDKIQKKHIIFDFFNAKRKGNAVKKFIVQNNEIVYFENEILEAKKIPKNVKDSMPHIPIFVVVAGENELVFQDINQTVNFLKLEDDKISKANFFELQEDDDILIYDNDLEDYNIVSIDELIIIDDNEKIDDLDQNCLSPYIIYTETGIIVNNFMLI